LEKGIRFGCGFFFGLFFVFANLIFFSLHNGYYIAGAFLFSGVVFGLLAMRFGDRFWEHLSKYWWWA